MSAIASGFSRTLEAVHPIACKTDKFWLTWSDSSTTWRNLRVPILSTNLVSVQALRSFSSFGKEKKLTFFSKFWFFLEPFYNSQKHNKPSSSHNSCGIIRRVARVTWDVTKQNSERFTKMFQLFLHSEFAQFFNFESLISFKQNL